MLSKLLKSQLVFLVIVLTACGGGGGGNGGGNSSSSSPSAPIVDIDGDGHLNADDAFPNDPSEWSDVDGDGTGDNADTTPMGTPMPQWTTIQGNAQHTGSIPVTLNPSDFKQRWRKAMQLSNVSEGTAGGGYLFFSDNGGLYAFHVTTGTTAWVRKIGSYNQPAYADGIVYIQASEDSELFLHAFNAANGEQLFKRRLTGYWMDSAVPVVAGGTVYVSNGYSASILALDAVTGNEKWSSLLGSSQTYTAAINSTSVISYTQSSPSDGLNVTDRKTGVTTYAIPDAGFDYNWYGSPTAVVSQESFALVIQGGRLIHFNLKNPSIAWEKKASFYGQPAIHDQHIYAINDGSLEILNLADGGLLKTITRNQNFIGSPLVTNNLVFVRDAENIYAYNLESGAQVWTVVARNGRMSMADGALYILDESGIRAIDVEGDIDGDGLPDWWEKLAGKNLIPGADLDGDGLSATEEYTHFTNPIIADSDGDELSDGDEIEIHFSSPLKADTDGDSLTDADEVMVHFTNPNLVDSDADNLDDFFEISLALNPNNAADATADNDQDGFQNFHEALAHTDFNNPQSVPVVSDWGMVQANAKHNGFQPVVLNSNNFNLRWSKTFPQSVREVATGGENIFLVDDTYRHAKLTALSVLDGEEKWQHNLRYLPYASAPSYRNNIVYLLSGGQANTALWAFNANNGEQLFRSSVVGDMPSYRAPTIFNDVAYINSGYYSGMIAVNASSGANIWSTESTSWNETWDPAVNDASVFHPMNGNIVSRSRTTGSVESTIEGTFYNSTPVLGSRNNIILHDNRVYSYDLSTQKRLWESQDSISPGIPAVGNQSVYFISENKLVALNEVDGKERWSWASSLWLDGNIIATISHIFVSSASGGKTYALSSFTGELLWSYDQGGRLSLGRDGALYISSGNSLHAINLTGDTDEDGMPDWWENLHGLNINSIGDAALDLDGDGLTNLQEFVNKASASKSDSDGDGLSDYEEVNQYETNPNSNDSDQDGMFDGQEIPVGLDPTDSADRNLDLDGDGISNYFELSEGTDPTNALSLPTFFDAGTFSFENAQLPTGWSLSEDSSSVSIVSDSASDGSYSLSIMNTSSLLFEGFFEASDISLDMKTGCSYGAGEVEIYLDGERWGISSMTSEWTKFNSVIPFGRHQVSIRIASYSCSVNIDNIVIAPAASVVDLSLQTVVLRDSKMEFLNDEGLIVRTIEIAPRPGYEIMSLTMSAQDKVIVGFNGFQSHIGIFDLNTFIWSYHQISEPGTGSNLGAMAAQGDYVYVSALEGLVKMDITNGDKEYFGSHFYNAIAVDSLGIIYAHSNGILYRYNPETLALVNSVSIQQATAIAVDTESRIIVATSSDSILRYNDQHLIDKQMTLDLWVTDIGIDAAGRLTVAGYYGPIRRYDENWEEYIDLDIQAQVFDVINQPDMPD